MMPLNSHVDISKLNKVPPGCPFQYKDVVRDDYPDSEHSMDGRRFKEEVETKAYDNVILDRETDEAVVYRKL